LQAISAFLRIDRESVSEWIVRLDLPTPHDRPMRQSRSLKAWAVEDYFRFIECWTAGWRADSIGQQFGRSAGAVWSKARWLGLPRRDRRDVVRIPPEALTKAEGPLLEEQPAAVAPERFVLTAAGTRLPVPTIASRGHVFWTAELDAELANRYWANQHYAAIAVEWGLSARAIASRACRLELPRRERAKLVPHYDPSVIAGNIAEAGYVHRKCLSVPGWWFWAQKNGPRISKRGQLLRQRSGAGYGFGSAHSVGVHPSAFGL
jgi:hypothetical protein